MLQTLVIKNFALIEDIKVSFSEGFTIITGETGAGKSILLDALSLILGKRADLSVLRNEQEKCIIEAEFAIEAYNLAQFFQQEDVDYESVTHIRREILPSGKSRAFINDTPVTLDVLSQLGKILVDIHSQHETQMLGNEDFQFHIVDTLAQNNSLLEQYREDLKNHRKNTKKLKELLEFQKNTQKEYDYNSFILNELQEASLEEGMQEELEEIQERALNVEDIKERLSQSGKLLADDEIGIVNQLRELKASFSGLSDYGENYSELFSRIENAFIEVDDIAQEVYDLAENVDFDPKELNSIQQTLQKIYNLQKKHQVNSVTELLKIQAALESQISKIDNIEEEISLQEKQVVKSLEIITKSAENIRENRQKSIPILISLLEKMLGELGMPNARFQIELKPLPDFTSNGNDEIHFLFSANKGGNFGLIKKVASGGELSRIMLSVKSILATKVALPTIIFDEIDTGVSGEISQKMGEIMKQMSGNRQVFAITHLPQVASKGDKHFKVFKEDIHGKTTTQLKELSTEERIEELAQMLGGKDITPTAYQHAKQLLGVK